MMCVPIAALVVALALLPGAARSAEREPAPLRGPSISGKTNLRLLVADDPPFVLDVDTGRSTPVRGVPKAGRGTLGVFGIGGRSAVVLAHSGGDGMVYGVLGRAARVSPLGAGRNAWPARDGRSAWIQSSLPGSRCTLRRVALSGREIRWPRAFPCATGSDPSGGSLGLVVHRTNVFDPLTGRPVLKTRWGILAATGKTLVLAGPGKQLTLLDAETRVEQRLPWPSSLSGLDRPAVDPGGLGVALAFANPSAAKQVLDVWFLNAQTGRLAQLPGMPAFVSLKRTSMAWTDDGRLVLLAESGGKDVIATWRPGRNWLALKAVRLPERTGGSDSFALLR